MRSRGLYSLRRRGRYAGLHTYSGRSGESLPTTAPVISSSVPADDDTDASTGGTIVITFDQDVVVDTAAADNLTIQEVGVGAFETFNLGTGAGSGGGSSSIAGRVVTLTPGSNRAASTAYSIRITATALDSAVNGLSFAGISDDTTLNFTTASGSTAGEAVGLLLTLTKAA